MVLYNNYLPAAPAWCIIIIIISIKLPRKKIAPAKNCSSRSNQKLPPTSDRPKRCTTTTIRFLPQHMSAAAVILYIITIVDIELMRQYYYIPDDFIRRSWH